MIIKPFLPLCLVCLLLSCAFPAAQATDITVIDEFGFVTAFDENESAASDVNINFASDIDFMGDVRMKGAKNTNATVDYHVRTNGYDVTFSSPRDFAIDGGANTTVHLYDTITLGAWLVVANGTLQVNSGANVEFEDCLVGDTSNYPHSVNARLVVDGGRLRITNDLKASDSMQNNSVSVKNGGRLEVGGNASIANGNNALHVSGADSAAVIEGILFLNNDAGTGIAKASVDSGGLLESTGMVLGSNAGPGGTGEITVAGAGTQLVVKSRSFTAPSRTNTSASSISARDGAAITVLGGGGNRNIVMNGFIEVGQDARLEMLAGSSSQYAAIDLRDGSTLISGEKRELRIENRGTFRSEHGRLAADEVNFKAGSIYEVHLAGADCDRFEADLATGSGRFVIESGAEMRPVIADTSIYKLGQSHAYQVVTLTTGAMDGGFDVQRSLTLDKTFINEGTRGTLRIARDAAYADLLPPGSNVNPVNVARAFDEALARGGLSEANRVFLNTLDAVTGIDEYLDIIKSARADHHAVSLVHSMHDARTFQNLVFGRMNLSGDDILSGNEFTVGAARGDALASPRVSCGGFKLWGQAIGTEEKRRRDDGYAAFRYRQAGLVLGADRYFGAFLFGAAAGYSHGRTRFDNLYGAEDADVLNLAVYGRYRHGGFRLDASVGYASAWRDVSRYGSLGRAEFKPRDDVWSGGVMAGYEFATGAWRATPEAGAFVYHVRRGSGSEKGTGLLPRYSWDRESTTSGEFPVGARLAYAGWGGPSARLKPEVSAHYVFMGGSRRVGSHLGLAADPAIRFVNYAPGRGDGYMRLAARLATRLNDRADLDISYRASIGHKWHEQTLGVGLSMDF